MASWLKSFVLLWVLVVLGVLLFVCAQHVEAQVSIVVNGSGVAFVSFSTSVGEGVSNILLPVPPIAPSIEVYSNPSVEWIYENNTLYIVSPSPTTLNITYIANATIENGIITLSIATNNTVRLLADPSIVLLTLPENITNATILPGNRLSLTFTGPATISYTLTAPQTTSPTPKPTQTPITTSTTAPQTIISSTTTPMTVTTGKTTITVTTSTATSSTTSTTATLTTAQSQTTAAKTSISMTRTMTTQTATPTPTTTMTTPPPTYTTLIIVIIIVIAIALAILIILRRRFTDLTSSPP
uniref:Uncharacterized protein n=1 Tax=Ignisphaera aggregans TaxID=334771 RepID=A0A7J2U2I2_9CREN